jgi:hypothetical protein
MAERLRRRRAAPVALAVAVGLIHLWLVDHLADRMVDVGAAAAMPPRIEVAYVRELELAAAPLVAPVLAPVPPAPKPKRALRPAPTASEPVIAAQPEPAPQSVVPPPEPEAPPVVAEAAPEPPREAASAAPAADASAVVAAASAPAPAASAAAPFEWPASTRLSYKLSGNVRGEVHGDAQVEWLRAETRYQVHLDVIVGLPIAPLLTRRMSSDGQLTSEGLAPSRYDEDTKVAFRPRRRVAIVFGPDVVLLPDGRRLERWPGLQDTASQFVQLSWLFTLQPELLRAGRTVEMPLALPRSVDRWVYDVLEEEEVYTPFGAVPAVHIKPRRTSRPGGDLSAEMWFAPQLRYLPVRIRIRQDAETYIDLVLSRRPEMAGP